jgi:pimeloyl-ACP methyl ester carboxylesterase
MDSPPIRHGYRIARLARDAHELLDRLAIDHADVLGWSMGVSVWWSFIDQYGTDRIRRFIAVDQPAAAAAVPWMSEQAQADRGAIFDVAALLSLAEALHGPDSQKATADLVRSMFSGGPDPAVWALVKQEIKSTPPSCRRPAALGPLRAGLARRRAPHRCPDLGHRLRRQPYRPELSAVRRRTDPRRPTAHLPSRCRELPLFDSSRTRPLSTRWSGNFSTRAEQGTSSRTGRHPGRRLSRRLRLHSRPESGSDRGPGSRRPRLPGWLTSAPRPGKRTVVPGGRAG